MHAEQQPRFLGEQPQIGKDLSTRSGNPKTKESNRREVRTSARGQPEFLEKQPLTGKDLSTQSSNPKFASFL